MPSGKRRWKTLRRRSFDLNCEGKVFRAFISAALISGHGVITWSVLRPGNTRSGNSSALKLHRNE